MIEEKFSARFVWGKADCCLTVADCLVGLGLPDPMEIYRGRYSTERGALRMFSPEGGLEGAMKARMAECGYKDCEEGGLVGLVRTSLGPTACLFHKGYWWAKSEEGAQAYPDDAVYMRWGHECHRPSR